MSELWIQCFTCGIVTNRPQPTVCNFFFDFFKIWIFQISKFGSLFQRRRRIDRSMIGNPTNFRHTAHVGGGGDGSAEMSNHVSFVFI